MKYVLRLMFGLLCLAAGAVTFLLIASPTDLLRDRLVEAVRAETGRDLVIASGSMRLTTGLSVSFNDAALLDPADDGAAIVRMQRLDVSVPVWQLLGRRVSVERLVMVRPVFELKTDAEGRRNWEFIRPLVRHGQSRHPVRLAAADTASNGERISDAASPKLRMAAADPADNRATNLEPVYLAIAGLGLKEIRVVDGIVRLSDERTKARREITHVDLAVALAGPAEQLTLEGRLKLDGEPLQVNASLASPRSLASGRASPIAVRFASNFLEGRFEGKLGMTPTVQLAGKIEAKGASLRRLLALMGMEPPPADAYGAYAVTGELLSDGRRIGLAKSVMEIDGAVVEGGLAFVLGDRRRLEADLTASRIDLNRFLGISPEASQKKPLTTATTPADPKTKQEVRGWSNAAFNLSLLKGIDADVKLRAREMIFLGYRLENARLASTLEGGVLKAHLAEMQLYRGRGTGGLLLDATGHAARLIARFSFDGVDAQGLLRAAASYDRLTGKARMEIDIESEGADQQTLMSALSGKAELKVTEGAVIGIDLNRMLKGLRKGQFLGLSNNESERTEFSDLAATFTIAKGRAQTADLRLISQPLRATGDGVIDLGQQQFDLNLRPKLLTADSEASADAGFEVPVRIQGPWDKPRYLVDAEAVLKNPSNVKEGIRQIEKAIKDKNVEDARKLLKGLIKR